MNEILVVSKREEIKTITKKKVFVYIAESERQAKQQSKKSGSHRLAL